MRSLPSIETPLNSWQSADGAKHSSALMDAKQLRSQQRSSVASEISVLTLNVAAAAVDRAALILEWLVSRGNDIMVLTETSAGPGTQLLIEGLERHGYTTVHTAVEQDRGALVASRLAVRRRLCASFNVTLPWRIAAIELVDTGLVIVGVYVPSRDRSVAKVARKREFIESLLAGIAGLPRRLRRAMVLAGDYNVVSRSHVPALNGYFAYEYKMLESLADLGFVGGHELSAELPQPHSWIGRTGTGYLYDYFHFGQQVTPFVTSCHYEQGTRELRLSDHAAVTATLRLGAVGRG
jgi:exodeoxyribonuclease-3